MVAAGTSAKVFLMTLPASKHTDQHPIAACAFNVSGKPSPCVIGAKFAPATRVFIEGAPALLVTGIGIGSSAEQAPQGPAAFLTTQIRVVGM
jgi:hypothetical protein